MQTLDRVSGSTSHMALDAIVGVGWQDCACLEIGLDLSAAIEKVL